MKIVHFACIAVLAVSHSHLLSAQNPKITHEKIWASGEFSSKSIRGLRSMNDGLHYTRTVSDNGGLHIVKYAYETGAAVDTLVHADDLYTSDGQSIHFDDYAFNSDESRVLLTTERVSIYRHSSKGHFYALNLSNKDIKPITDFSKGKQQLAEFSPKANSVAFVRNNNLFVADLDQGTETQVTKDGKWNHIINGAVDWVYEEEFSFHRGFYWSPEGTKIAFYRFDESEVPEFSMAMYDGLYPDSYTFKYPKAGETNSTVQVMVYDLIAGTVREVRINPNPDQYIPRIKWTQSDHQLCVMRMNRHQNHLEFLLAETWAKSADIPVSVIYEERADTYIEINDNLIFLNDGKHFLWNSERDGWNHIYLQNMKGEEVGRITQGQWEVINFYGADQDQSTVYFSAAMDSPLEVAIYAMGYGDLLKTGKSGSMKPVKLTKNDGNNAATFSKNYAYFINASSNANMPPRYTLCYHTGDEIRVLEDNAALRERLNAYHLQPKEFGSFTTAQGHSLNYWMIKPEKFNPDYSYPILFMIYGGPGSNTVSKSWGGANYMWHQMLAQSGFIVVSVDPRGTMRRGRKFKHSTYLQLGKLETEDFMEAARYFGGLDFVDETRMGMMGWSYGGYMSSLCITKGAELFKLAIAVAPVTNWRYYDTVYTERFMRTPQENPDGYDDNSPIFFVDQLKGDYLLVHGSADDNVHYQNSMEMVKALVDADKDFELMIYPNKNHSIYGGNTRKHLFRKMTDFIVDRL